MTATLTYTLGKFVWRELYTRDVAAAKRFYGALFGWTTEERPMGPDWSYTIWKVGDVQIAGMMDIAHLPTGQDCVPPHWASYVSVEDVDAAAARAVAKGGRLVSECMDIPGVGRFAAIQDPQGAIVSLFRSSQGDPEDGVPGIGEFCWDNLSTHDAAAAVAFYEDVVGWNAAPMEGGEALLFRRDTPNGPLGLASIGPVPEGGQAAWTPFVAVEDIVATTAKVRELGGQVFVERTEIPNVGAFGVIQDPAEAVIFLFEMACGA